jgi:hypothetical protein
MPSPIHDPFFPVKKFDDRRQIPMKDVLLGHANFPPIHPDPSLEIFLRYVPSIFLQSLGIELDKAEWHDLADKGTDSDHLEAYRHKISDALEKQKTFFEIPESGNGFYQHENARNGAEARTDLDALLVHGTSGNNPMHHRAGHTLDRICASCALLALMHHDNFCTAGTVGHSNFRGQTCYLCMIGETDPFKRMILNTVFPTLLSPRALAGYGWKGVPPDSDVPTWIRPGTPTKTGFRDLPGEVGPIRAALYTPRHVVLDFEAENGTCDLCGLESDRMVRRYWWERYGDKLDAAHVAVRHPAQAVYRDEKIGWLPLNYNPSVWRNLGSLVVKEFKETYDVAPTVRQFTDLKAGQNPFFTLELMAFAANQAKLLDFHHAVIRLPPASDPDEMAAFYENLEAFARSAAAMLRAFRVYGTEDPKRNSRVPVAAVPDRHDQWTDDFGRDLLSNLEGFWADFRENRLRETLKTRLERLRRELGGTFEALCQDEYAWEDIPAQRKLNGQKRMLWTALKKIAEDFDA